MGFYTFWLPYFLPLVPNQRAYIMMLHTYRFYAVLGLLLGLGVACSSTQYTLDTLPERQLYFGSGGGFAGTTTEYMLLDNGQLFRNDPKGYTPLEPAKAGEARRAFKQFYKMKLDTLSYNEPGNLYYFIRMKDEGATYEITWGSNKDLPNDNIETYYQRLNQIINP